MGTSPKDQGAALPLLVYAVTAMMTMAALVAMIVAGFATADLFPATGTAAEVASDRGLASAITAWASPLALAGLAVTFGIAIPLALQNVRSAINDRRDAMVSALPQLIVGERR